MQLPADLEIRRLAVFLGVAFGLSWAVGLAVYLTGGLTDSPELAFGIPLWFVLVAGPYMWGPAVANVATRLATGEGWDGLLLRPRLPGARRYWVVAWVAPVALVLLGAGVYFAAFPGRFGGFDAVGTGLEELGVEGGVSPGVFVALQFAQAALLAPLLNAPATFGEEFGWRGYLLPKLAPLGIRRSLLLHGAVWGVWHWPVVAMGYNYGREYPGAPWTGLLGMVAFTVVLGVFLGWLALRAGSVWPAVLGHAAVNGFAGFPSLFATGEATPLLGPSAIGLLAMLPWVAVAAWLLWDADRLEPAWDLPGADGEVSVRSSD